MNETTSGLKSINELLEHNYCIPSYQRGYRWTKEQVEDLLEDIWEFYKQKKSDEYYCLQPIVVSKSGDNIFTVIDGQQRLTTISIILRSMEEVFELLFSDKEIFNITYETRKDIGGFIQKIDLGQRDKNIDYYHICQAQETIQKWFENNDSKTVAKGHDPVNKVHFLNTLLGAAKPNVQVIWYEPENTEDHIEVFTRLNMGKIGLTNAELIKALFLSKYQTMSREEKEEQPRKQKEIAAEWDRYENTLRNDEFWGFLQNGAVKYDNHIELIFDIIADNLDKDGKRKDLDKYKTFRYFTDQVKSDKGQNKGQKSVAKAWSTWDDNVKATFHLIHDWYTDKRLYHLIGFLIASGHPLRQLINETSGRTKSSLDGHLKTQISETLKSAKIDEMIYLEDKKALRNVMLLFNVLSIINSSNANIRFQFGRYKSEKWDIEHIHSVSSEMPKDKAHKLDWLREVSEHMEFSKDQKKHSNIFDKITSYRDSNNKSKPDFERLYNEVLEIYSEGKNISDINDISNLTLLDVGTNRGYKNAIFPIKRRAIIKRDQEGKFIPFCTRNVFLKYYNDSVKQTTFWGKEDQDSYKKQMKETLDNYLNPSKS